MLLSRIWRDTLSVGEPQVLLYLDDMKITPSNPHKAKPPIARVTSVEVPGAGAAPDTSSEAAGAGVRPGIEFWLERVMDESRAIWTRWRSSTHSWRDCSEYSRHVDGWTTAGAARRRTPRGDGSELCVGGCQQFIWEFEQCDSTDKARRSRSVSVRWVVSEAAMGHKICS